MKTHDPVKIRGMFRVQIEEDGKIVGDSGWKPNQVTNLGIREYLVHAIIGNSPLTVSHMTLGTGGAPASNATVQAGELTHTSNARVAVTTSVVASGTAQFAGTISSANSFVTATANISNIGLWNTSTTAGGTLFAGNTFASSALATNQNVNMTYQVRFA